MEQGLTLTGRQTLLLLSQRLETSEMGGSVYETERFFDHSERRPSAGVYRLPGTRSTAGLRNRRMSRLRWCFFCLEICGGCKATGQDLAHFDHLPKGDPQKSYECLMHRARAVLECDRFHWLCDELGRSAEDW
jgi:hypothetical protein